LVGSASAPTVEGLFEAGLLPAIETVDVTVAATAISAAVDSRMLLSSRVLIFFPFCLSKQF
jgi:hypothetical protein